MFRMQKDLSQTALCSFEAMSTVRSTYDYAGKEVSFTEGKRRATVEEGSDAGRAWVLLSVGVQDHT